MVGVIGVAVATRNASTRVLLLTMQPPLRVRPNTLHSRHAACSKLIAWVTYSWMMSRCSPGPKGRHYGKLSGVDAVAHLWQQEQALW